MKRFEEKNVNFWNFEFFLKQLLLQIFSKFWNSFSQNKRRNLNKIMCWTFFSKKYLYFDINTFFSFQAICFSSIIESVNAFFSWTAIHITYSTIVNDSIHIYHNFLCFKELSKKISLTLARLCLKNFKAVF
jgi:hypothetical protein